MSYTASELIKIAEAEVGYLEKYSNSNLDSKTGNAGYNNYTKYARDLYNADYYNGNKNGYAWCDVFVDWCHWIAAGKNAKEAQRVICQTGDCGAGCTYSAQYYRNAGRFYSSPKVGDQIFFGDSGDEYHTGIVYAVDSSKVYTIEGNTSGASGVVDNGGGVFKKSYSRSYYDISGYGRPRYDETAEVKDTKPTTSTTVNKGEKTVNIELKELRKGSNNYTVKALQRMLHGMGYNIGSNNPIDGDFGPKTDAAVRSYQRTNNLEVDGIVGEQTWTKLLKG